MYCCISSWYVLKSKDAREIGSSNGCQLTSESILILEVLHVFTHFYNHCDGNSIQTTGSLLYSYTANESDSEYEETLFVHTPRLATNYYSMSCTNRTRF